MDIGDSMKITQEDAWKHNKYNGRLNIKQPNTQLIFQMYDKIPVKQTTALRNPTEGLWDNTVLSQSFFSAENIQIIQNGIRSRVYSSSNGKYTISEQDEATLKIIMRSIFLQQAVNQPTDIAQQVYALNESVWSYCVPQVLNECKGYNIYLNDVSKMYVPMDAPILAKVNDKQLELKKFF